ncbi:GatB/YqeY domain-containing protein [Glycomyces halotolerans]
MSELKTQLETDMRSALKSKDKVTLGTLRMVLAAVRNEEVAGKSARELSDDEVIKVLIKQAKQRREAAEAFQDGGRPEQAQGELAEEAVIKRYLPEELSEAELTDIVRSTIAEGGFSGPKDMGKVMKAVQPKVAGRADGKVVAGIVKAELGAAG